MAQCIRGMKEPSAIHGRDSCKLQPLFQKRGLTAMTEPPQPSAPPHARPHSHRTVPLCAHTLNAAGDLCIEKVLTPSQQYVLCFCPKKISAGEKWLLPHHPFPLPVSFQMTASAGTQQM